MFQKYLVELETLEEDAPESILSEARVSIEELNFQFKFIFGVRSKSKVA